MPGGPKGGEYAPPSTTGVGAGGAPNVEGQANVQLDADIEGQSRTASSAPSGSGTTDLNVEADLVSKPANLSNETQHAQGEFSAESAEAGVSRNVGPEGQSVIQGGGAGVAERQVGGVGADTSAARQVARGEELEAKGGVEVVREGAIGQTGYSNPESEVARADVLAFHEKDQLQAKADVADNARTSAEATYADPRGAAKAEASIAANEGIRENSPVDPYAAQADANQAEAAIQNPEVAATSRVDLEVEAKERETAAKVGVDGTGTGRNRPEPGGKDKP